MYGEGVGGGRLVALVEEVHELLDPDGVGIGQMAVLDEAPGDRIRGRVHIHREGRQVVVLSVDEGIDAVVLEEGHVVGGVVHGRGASYDVEVPLGRGCLHLNRHLLDHLLLDRDDPLNWYLLDDLFFDYDLNRDLFDNLLIDYDLLLDRHLFYDFHDLRFTRAGCQHGDQRDYTKYQGCVPEISSHFHSSL